MMTTKYNQKLKLTSKIQNKTSDHKTNKLNQIITIDEHVPQMDLLTTKNKGTASQYNQHPFAAGDKPSTRLLPGELVEQLESPENRKPSKNYT